MRFFLLIFNFFSKPNIRKTNNILPALNSGRKYEGYDHRYINYYNVSVNDTHSKYVLEVNYDTLTPEDVYNFNRNFFKYALLQNLMNPKISEITKLEELELYNGYQNKSKYVVDITSGGLFNDWDSV
jgi:hypothetical protein